MNRGEALPTPEHREHPCSTVINADIGIRHKTIARALTIPYSAEMSSWCRAREENLRTTLQNHLQEPITMVNMVETQRELADKVEVFKNNAVERNRRPFIVSLDAIILEAPQADYVFQETRASLTGPHVSVVNLEHNPRGHVNRFARVHSERNGAGKSSFAQLEDIKRQLIDSTLPIDLGIVEDYVNTGDGLIEHFSELIDDPNISTTLFAGVINQKAYDRFTSRNISCDAVWPLEKNPRRYMDAIDFLPTLGGRTVGWSRDTQHAAPVLRTAGGIGRQIPMAVDAMYGNYPWQVDIYSEHMKGDLITSLREFSLATAWQFWASLEQMAGHELRWEDLKDLNGKVKVFYPMQDLTSSRVLLSMVGSGPRAVIEAIMTKEASNE